jgi:hypothetical protein
MNNQTSTSEFNLFRLQRRSTPILLGWSLASILAGMYWLHDEDSFLKGVGSQFVGWGLIDGIIALIGSRSATVDEESYKNGEISKITHQEKTRGFERLLWLNAILDIGYILGGGWLIRRFPEQAQRRGMGWGIIFQGAFLLVWDVILACLVRGRRS